MKPAMAERNDKMVMLTDIEKKLLDTVEEHVGQVISMHSLLVGVIENVNPKIIRSAIKSSIATLICCRCKEVGVAGIGRVVS